MARDSLTNGRKARVDTTSLSPTTPDRVNTTIPGLQTNPAVAALTDGGYVVAWVSFNDSGPRSIYTQRYTAEGVEVGGETLASSRLIGTGEVPSVAGLTDGGYVVAYPYRLGTTVNSTSLVLFQRVDGEGQRVGPEVTVSGFTFDYMDRTFTIVGSPTVAALDNGGWVVGWLQEFNDPTASPPRVETTFAQRYDSSGAPVGEPASYPGNTPVQPLADGGYLVGTLVFDGAGAPAGELSPDLTGTRAYAIDAFADGGFVAITLSQDNVLAVQLLDAEGDPLGDRVPFATGSVESLPEVAPLPDGGFVAVWHWRSAPDAPLQLLAQRFDDSGSEVGGTLVIEPPDAFATASNLRAPAVTVLEDGDIAVSWVASGPQGPDVFTAVLEEALAGTAGRDHIGGTDGDDVLHGHGGRDRLQALAGDDQLEGGAGADKMAGGPGDDQYFVDHTGDRVVERPGEGHDTVIASVDYALPRNVEVLVLHGAALAGRGNALDNLLVGSALANRLDGAGGNDTVEVGAGADVVVFSAAPGPGNVDSVVGFDAAEDHFELAAGIFDAIGVGPLAAGAFRAGTQASEEDDRILFDPTTGMLAYDADGSGSTSAVQVATLTGVQGVIGADNFVVQ